MIEKTIVLASRKGGVGKTPLALSLAIDLDRYLITNDKGIATVIYKNSKYLEVPVHLQDTVYDFGGFASAGVIDVVKKCDILIIPVINEYDAFVKTFLTIEELEKHAKEIILVATRTGKNDIAEIREQIHRKFPKMRIFELSQSKIFKNVTKEGKSVLELADRTPLNAWGYRNIKKQYITLLDYVKGVK